MKRGFSGSHLLEFCKIPPQSRQEFFGLGKVTPLAGQLHLIGCLLQGQGPHGPGSSFEGVALVTDGGGVALGDGFFEGMNPLGSVFKERSHDLLQELLIIIDLLK